METALASVLLDERTRVFLDHDGTPGRAAVQLDDSNKSLQQLLQAVGQAASADGSGADAGASGKGPTTFELFLKPGTEAGTRLGNIADADRRLAVLEKLVGSAPDPQMHPDMQSSLSSLHQKLSLLDPSQLDKLQARIASLQSDLKDLEEEKRKAAVPSSEHESRVASLYATVSRWDATAQQLPAVVARLQSLRELHEESADAVLRLQAVERQSAGVDELLKEDKQLLQDASESLASNMETMQANMTHLEQRFAALEQKLQKL